MPTSLTNAMNTELTGVILIEDPLLKNFTTDGYTKVIYDAIQEYKPEIVLYGATHIGRDLAPRIAARLQHRSYS